MDNYPSHLPLADSSAAPFTELAWSQEASGRCHILIYIWLFNGYLMGFGIIMVIWSMGWDFSMWLKQFAIFTYFYHPVDWFTTKQKMVLTWHCFSHMFIPLPGDVFFWIRLVGLPSNLCLRQSGAFAKGGWAMVGEWVSDECETNLRG